MNFSRDEVRRQLRATRAEHEATMGPWQEALRRIFGSGEVPAEAKAHLLGMPSRRGFLKIGGATVLGAAVLAACGSDGELVESGVPDGATTTADASETEFDTNLLRTATSLEILAVDTYQTAIDSGLIGQATILEAFTLFRDQHDDHRAALQQATEDYAGAGTAYEETNQFLQDTVVGPALEALTDEESVISLALRLETLAAESYVWSAGQLSTTTLRQAIMGIGGVEGRHQAVLRGFLEEEQVPDAFENTDEAIEEDAYVGADGDAGSGSGDTGGGDAGGSGGDTGGGATTTTAGDSTTTTSG
ncbi:MAG TPA: ferritin-like domain-containing protein, partial [Acidimicrobiales bacterium]|nr:ferritin-like domain-containing protein [Acidimicrobiales bacterium]